MILRELAEARIRSGNDLDDLAESYEGSARAAIGLWHGNPPEAARREVVELGGGKPLFTVPLRRFHRELGRELLRDSQRLLIGSDTCALGLSSKAGGSCASAIGRATFSFMTDP